jgi:hypothetical protein
VIATTPIEGPKKGMSDSFRTLLLKEGENVVKVYLYAGNRLHPLLAQELSIGSQVALRSVKVTIHGDEYQRTSIREDISGSEGYRSKLEIELERELDELQFVRFSQRAFGHSINELGPGQFNLTVVARVADRTDDEESGKVQLRIVDHSGEYLMLAFPEKAKHIEGVTALKVYCFTQLMVKGVRNDLVLNLTEYTQAFELEEEQPADAE